MDAARQRAMQAMAWADELEDLREFDVADVQGNLAKPAAATATPADNGILTARAGTASAGIDTGAIGQPTGNTHLTDREAAAVASNIPSSRQRPVGGGGRGASRTDEDIQLVFDRYKGAIDRIYNKALRRDPTLQGKIVFKLTIAPSGKVTKISIVSSEMNNPALEKRLMTRIKLFNFGAKPVGTVTVTYPVVFLPS
ncbi:MAG TPA: TonB family protein [Gammaproteobacteria bacterium]|nr:TonB family protein [Gammaproteobacteria bacterium]